MRKYLFLALIAFLPTAALADVPTNRFQKEYARFVYDFAVNGGAVGQISTPVTLPANMIITNVYAYINTAFTGSAGASIGFGCVGTNDLFAYHDFTNVTEVGGVGWYYAGALTGTAFKNGKSVLNFDAPALHADNGKSVVSDCNVTVNIGNAAITAGKFTGVVEYFRF